MDDDVLLSRGSWTFSVTGVSEIIGDGKTSTIQVRSGPLFLNTLINPRPDGGGNC